MNKLNLPLTDKVVLVDKEFVNDNVIDRRFLCEGGFGCQTFTLGSKIFGKWLSDNTPDTIHGDWIESLVE